MKIYLDIDGTLLGEHGKPTQYLHEFLAHVTSRHDTYWLTTHCKGNANGALAALEASGIDHETFELAKRIKPTSWDVLKTEAINMDDDFVWFDDSPMASELVALEKAGRGDRLYGMDTRTNPEALREALDWLHDKEGEQ